jgi:tight adherence protein B
MTGWVLTLLPIVLGTLMYAVNPEMMSVLWTNPMGIKMLWTAGGMIVVGGFVINRIVNMDV